jgi:hypothetical protein
MNMTVGNTGLNIGNIKSNAQAGGKLDREFSKNTFSEVRAGQLVSGDVVDSQNKVSTTATSAAKDTATASLSGTSLVDQLLMQGRLSIPQDADPKAASDASRVDQQSAETIATVTATATSAQAEILTTSQRADQLLVHGRLALQQGADPKVAADGSTSAGQVIGDTTTNSARAATVFPAGTFKAMFGELPTNVNSSGLSGIVNAQGHNLTNQEITSYFAQNPSTTQMEQDKVAMGLSDAQMTHAIAIAMGQPYADSALVANANSIASGVAGSQNAVNNLYSNTWGGSGVQSGVTAAASAALSYQA